MEMVNGSKFLLKVINLEVDMDIQCHLSNHILYYLGELLVKIHQMKFGFYLLSQILLYGHRYNLEIPFNQTKEYITQIVFGEISKNLIV